MQLAMFSHPQLSKDCVEYLLVQTYLQFCGVRANDGSVRHIIDLEHIELQTSSLDWVY